MKRIAIITARGGSKRIPKKNIRDFCGKPIIVYGIQAALDAGIFDEVMVSTDSEEIAEIAREYGANVPFMRSEHTASDFATTAEVIIEVLDRYREMGKHFDTAVCIYPTAPFVTAKKLQEGVSILETGRKIQAMPVVKFSYPPQRGFVRDDDEICMKYPEYRDSRSQDLEPIFHDAGQFYCYNVEEYVKANGKVSEHIAPIFVSELEVHDIDTEEDWKMAELKYINMTERYTDFR